MAARVSVLMPLFEPDRVFLARAVDSIRAQSLTDWELIAIEDPPASDAGVLLRATGDSRIHHVLRTAKATLGDALNDGLSRCSAALVARIDADDVAVPERLAKQVAYLDDHPDTVVLGSALTVIDASDKVIGHRRMPVSASDVTATMRRHNAVAHPSVMFRKQIIIDMGGYDATAKTEDYDLWCRVLKAGHRIENLRDELLRYRFHSGALKFDAVHDVIRASIATKERYFENDFTLRDRIRMAAERSLLHVPPKFILKMFRFAEYRS